MTCVIRKSNRGYYLKNGPQNPNWQYIEEPHWQSVSLEEWLFPLSRAAQTCRDRGLTGQHGRRECLSHSVTCPQQATHGCLQIESLPILTLPYKSHYMEARVLSNFRSSRGMHLFMQHAIWKHILCAFCVQDTVLGVENREVKQTDSGYLPVMLLTF